MDWNMLFTLIGSYGFPVIACVVMGVFLARYMTRTNKVIDDLRKTVDRNTRVMERLLDRIGGVEVVEK